MPRVVTAGVPTRTPLVTNGLRFSPGTVFLMAVMCTFVQVMPSSLPGQSSSVRSISSRWLSVPPENQLHAAGGQLVGHGLGVLHDLGGVLLELRLQGLAKTDSLSTAMTCSSGPPWSAREDMAGIDALDEVLVVGQNQTAAGTAQGLNEW